MNRVARFGIGTTALAVSAFFSHSTLAVELGDLTNYVRGSTKGCRSALYRHPGCMAASRLERLA